MTVTSLKHKCEYHINKDIPGPDMELKLKGTLKHPVTKVKIEVVASIKIPKDSSRERQLHFIKEIVANISALRHPNDPCFQRPSEQTPIPTATPTVTPRTVATPVNTRRQTRNNIIGIIAFAAFLIFLDQMFGGDKKNLPHLSPYLS